MPLPITFFILALLFFPGALPLAAKGNARPHTPPKPAGSGAPTKNLEETQRNASSTAEEYLADATRAMAEGRWRDATNAYTGFILDFSRPETESVIARFQPALALCFIRQQRFSDALIPIQKALKQNPPLPIRIQTALHLQSGLCHWHQGHYAQARESLSLFLSQSTSGSAFQQAHLLVAQCFLLEGNPDVAADRLSQCRPLLDQEHAAQAISMEIRARLADGQPEQALAVAEKHTQTLESSLEALSSQNSLLRMGSIFLDQGSFRLAIRCLRQVRSSRKLLDFGESQLVWLNTREASPNKTPERNSDCAIAQNRERLQKELENIRQCQNWDSLVRIQLASAYNGLQRFRESALVLTHALETSPADPLIEQAGVMLLQNWSTLECWSKLETAADLFQQKYPRSTHLQLAHFFKGIAQQKENRFEEALKTFHSVVTENPKSETGTRARFMFAFTELLSGEPARASVLFSDFIQQHARHELAEEASAWICVSYALAKKHELCLAAAASYKKRYSTGFNRPLVLFQECRAFLATGDYGATIAGFETFLKEFSQHPRAGEARLLLADALTATEKTETALTVLENAPVSDPSSFDEAWFKAAKILVASNSLQPLATHLERFKQSRPGSPRFGNAVLETAKALQSSGHTEEAQDLIWRTINTFLDDPKITAVEVLLEALPNLFHKGEPENERTQPLRDFYQEAVKNSNAIGLIRARWALSVVMRQSDSFESRKLLLDALPSLNPASNSDRILAAAAEACTEEGRRSEGTALWKDLLKWHPRSIYKDRVFATCIADCVGTGDRTKALSLIHRMEAECPDSPLRARALLAKATIQEQTGETASFKQTLEGLLAERRIPGEYKPEALLRLGDFEMQFNNPRKAIPFYQRIYILYGRYKPHLAKAYIRSAVAFEQIGDTEAAIRTYRELLAAELPDGCAEKPIARQNLTRLEKIQ